MTKKVSPVENDCGEESNEFRPIDDADQSLMEATFTNSSTSAEETDNRQSHVVPKEYKNPATGNMVVDQSSQTVFCKYTLSAKVDTMILRNEVAISKPPIFVLDYNSCCKYLVLDFNSDKRLAES